MEQWYFGEVLSKVTGTNEWYNVRYEGEVDVLTLDFHKNINSKGFRSCFIADHSLKTSLKNV